MGFTDKYDKKQIVLFSRGSKIRECEKWYLHHKMMNITPEYKYLGLYLTGNLHWNKAVLFSAS